MPQFVWKPEGATPKKWDFDPQKLMSPEAEAIERRTGMTYGEWCDALDRGSALATHGLLWVLLKRSDPTLKWESVEFAMGEIDVELTDEEAAEAVAELEAKAAQDGLSAREEAMLAELRAQGYSSADAAPKAPESSSDSPTPDSSPTF